MNPPYLIRTVELIRGRRTGDAAMAAATSLLSSLGQTPIAVATAQALSSTGSCSG
ncbi:3-hydroxyacyl-CoA dehydrogenase NAD-binding domain-containing protein [Streptomyces sp. NPDC002851]